MGEPEIGKRSLPDRLALSSLGKERSGDFYAHLANRGLL
jgi:hypothetical protein